MRASPPPAQRLQPTDEFAKVLLGQNLGWRHQGALPARIHANRRHQRAGTRDASSGAMGLPVKTKEVQRLAALWPFPLAEPTPTVVRVRMPITLAATPIKLWFVSYREVGEAIGASPNKNVRAGFLPRGH